MQKLLEVASRDTLGKIRWLSWKKLPSLLYYKKLYKNQPEKFTEIDGILYLKELDPRAKVRVKELFSSCLSLAGSEYALALALSGGDRKSKEFNATQKSLNYGVFKDTLKWMKTFEEYIKKYAYTVGMHYDSKIQWFDVSETLGIKSSTLQGYYSVKPELFEIINDVVFFLDTQNILLESMFFRAVEIAGSEYKLATAIGRDKKEIDKHFKNFERMTFKHPENFKCYSKLISEYLSKNNSLFDEEPMYA